MNTKTIFSSNTDEWSTPQDLYNNLNNEFKFTLDPCANRFNAKCKKFYTKEQDGLKQDWSGERVFCNPPYGKQISKWIQKAFEETYYGKCSCVVMLIPARTDTTWFHNFIYKKSEIRFIKGRVKFGGHTNNAPFPSMIVIFNNTKVQDPNINTL